MMILQPRDKKLLSCLSRYGVLSTSQIGSRLFQGVSHTTLMRRMRKIESEELILRRSGLPGAENAWCLTVKAAHVLGEETPCRYSNQNTISHEVGLSAIRMSLERVGLAKNWTSETELRRNLMSARDFREKDRHVIPDGIFVAKGRKTSGVVAVELELTAKGHSRYKNIFREYAKRDSITWIWYLVESKSIRDLIFRQWESVQRYHSSPKLFVSLASEILKDPRKSLIIDERGQAYLLGSVFELSSPKPLLTPNTECDVKVAQGVSSEDDLELSRKTKSNLESKQEPTAASAQYKEKPPVTDPSPPTML